MEKLNVLKDQLLGKTVSHYKILDILGEGGMGIVYKAEDIKLKRTVALKFLPIELTRDAHAKERFVHEAQAASALDHYRIGTIYEIDETDNGQMFISMAYYEGETLKKKIEYGQMEVKDAVDIVIQVASGLAKTHEQGIVHRDIKPSNIMFTDEGFVKIVDFGLAKLGGATRITKSGTSMGTPTYMSPEQVKGQEVDHRSDIWSLGVILYELVTGQLPFTGDYDMSILYSIVNEEPMLPSQINPSIPNDLEKIVIKAIQKQVDDRYDNMQEMLNDLKPIQQSFSQTAQITVEDDIATRVITHEEAQQTLPIIDSNKKKQSAISIILNSKTALIVSILLIVGIVGIAILPKKKQEYGFLKLNSNPPGADIILNGESTGQTTPTLIGPLKKGLHEITLQIAEFENWTKKFTISKMDTLFDSVNLVPIKHKFGNLVVKSNPTRASIFIDQEDSGLKTPAVLEKITAGQHEIQLKKVGYQSISKMIDITSDEVAEWTATLNKKALIQLVGSLFVDSEPQGALVSLNGKQTQHKTPYTFSDLTVGEYGVQLTLDGYEDQVTKVNVLPDQENKINITLKAEPLGRLIVTAVIVENQSAELAVAAVFVDGKPFGQIPAKISLKKGTYTVSAKKFGYIPKNGDRKITMKSGEDTTIKFEFIKK